jgi:hypothetical protein
LHFLVQYSSCITAAKLEGEKSLQVNYQIYCQFHHQPNNNAMYFWLQHCRSPETDHYSPGLTHFAHLISCLQCEPLQSLQPLTSPISGTWLVDDANAPAFGKLTEENCRTLQAIHE